MTSIACPYCQRQAPQLTGAQMYPHRPDLAAKRFFYCSGCDASVGCHPDGRPFGRMANEELRRARGFVHGLFDPLWQRAAEAYEGHDNGKIRGVARARAYRWLSVQLGIPVDECHVGMFDIDRCRAAYRILRDARMTPTAIREWAKAQKVAA